MSLRADREAVYQARRIKREQEKRLTVIFTALLMIACVLLGYFIATYVPTSSQARLLDEEGNPEAIRTLIAASRLCQSQATINYGDRLVNSLVDDYSTRYDEPRDLFVVLLITSVRKERMGYKDYRVHCHVLPEDTVVHYFRGFEIEA